MASGNENTTKNDELKHLIQKRGQVKASLTRFKSFLEGFQDNGSVTELETRFKRIENAIDDYETIQSQIELADENGSHETDRAIFEALYFELIPRAKDLINSKTANSTPIHSNPPSVDQPTPASQVAVKLPAIDLPTFNGKYEDWLPFSDSFKALIKSNESLTDVQRLHYLRSSLKGEAAHIISSLELTSNNYSVAWGLLEDRYQNTRIIVQRHVKAIFDLPPIEKDSVSSIRHLLDGTLKHLRALAALDEPTESWSTLLVHLTTTKMGQALKREWELTTNPNERPTFNQLSSFLQRRCQVLEDSEPIKATDRFNQAVKRKPNQRACLLTQSNKCRICNGGHAIHRCPSFLKLAHSERCARLREAGLCYNCLKPGHRVVDCQAGGCRICSKRHNTILHIPDSRPTRGETSQPQGNAEASAADKQPSVSALSAHGVQGTAQVLLSTALVDVLSATGEYFRCRALIDNGSQSCFITENIAHKLSLPRTRNTCEVSGISGASIAINGVTRTTIKSCISNYKVNLSFIIVPKITGNLPTEPVNLQRLKIPQHITLADPSFRRPGQIDMLIGQEIFLDLLCIGQIKSTGLPTLQKTKLGWLVGGRIDSHAPAATNLSCYLTTLDRLDRQLQNFWIVEEPTRKSHITAEEQACETHFLKNTVREADGRYTVKMPLRTEASALGESREMAVRRFLQIEKRLGRDQGLKEQYSNFMAEYLRLGHMERVTKGDKPLNEPGYFLPHHPVIKPASTTTKVRVVFDASAKTTSGLSLNDIQMVGPTVQSDIFSIILRFRLHRFVMTADLEKMYRQVNIDSSQRDFLKIVWREDRTQPLEEYRLKTVTYGTASASYLATRTLRQLAVDEAHRSPSAAKVIEQDFYVDDLMTGVSTEEEGITLQTNLIDMLSRGGFNLRKWNSNSSKILNCLPSHLCERQTQEFPKDAESTTKTLGLWWDAENDIFKFKYTPIECKARDPQVTKRMILSEIARLFDPLGLVSPVVVRAKMYLQELWKQKLAWDESLPMDLHTQWHQFMTCLIDLNDLVIERHAALPTTEASTYEVHGFSDASERAYGAVIYLRHTNAHGNVKCSLLCSKSRVAPLKTISLPRLELCGALLLAELMSHVIKALNLAPSTVKCWTDSTIVLSWLSKEPATWTTFVANRVAKIQDVEVINEWGHVNTDENPADLVSRGATTRTLGTSALWWSGPTWLSMDSNHWPSESSHVHIPQDIPETRVPKNVSFLASTASNQNDVLDALFERHSSYRKITRIVALCLRFIHNLRSRPNERNLERISTQEISSADIVILRELQKIEFNQEHDDLSRHGSLRQKSKLTSLAPFLDKDGVIRVGGRLNKSLTLTFEGRHPILLPTKHKVGEMIAREEHLRQLHCGPQALLYAIRQRYWPVDGRNLTRKIVHQCVRCFKAKPKPSEQLMGDLPSHRVNPARAFLHTGVDYCGPFYVRSTYRRNAAKTKAYVAVFVCLATKAVHLELVSNLTTDAFIAALKRFVSRRGLCAEITSDNGKTFVGARRELMELHQFLTEESSAIIRAALDEGINWKFIPPYSPHMGGLWEAAVKSLKHHLHRIAGSASLTFEEMTTVITQVEAVLNSRPLSPMSNDPSDLSVLTPGHFLTGGSLRAVPEPSLQHIPENRLSRWQRLQQLLQHFWARWSTEYLSNLQQRGKWKTPRPELRAGSLVLLREDNTPPLSWPMGRVVQLHPGSDGRVRVVTLKTSAGESKLNCEVLHEDLAFEVRWAIAGDSVVVQLVAKLENGEYMSFGVSGHERKNQMVGADVVVAWVDHETLNGYAVDYFLDDKSQCSGTRGSCPDYRIDPENTSSVRLLNAALVNGYSIVTYQRPLRAHDSLDRPILTNTSQAVIWGVGPLNQKQEVSFHSVWSKENILLDFGRTPQWNCPIPESDAALAASSHEHEHEQDAEDVHAPSAGHAHAQHSEQTSAERYQTPPPPAAAVRQSDAWEIPPIQCNEPDDGVFYAQMGPTGGKRGYPSITKHVGWGISYYINGLLIPEINVVRGKTYTFVVEGGLDPSVPAKYHPFYITDDPVGGYANKSPEEQKKVRIFAGVEQTRSGVLVPTGVGRLCNWTPDPEQPPADEFVSFGAYQRTLTLICDHGEPGVIQWTPDEDTPDTVYYQCFSHRYLGWKINVLDRCDLPAVSGSAPVETRVKFDPEADELEPHPSQRVATRVRPEGPNYLPLVSSAGLKNQDLMAEYKKNFAQIPVNFQEPQEYKYEQHGIPSNHKYPASTMDVYINQQIESTTEDGRQMIPVSEDTSQDISTERNRPVFSHGPEKNNSDTNNHHQTSNFNRNPHPQGSLMRPAPHQRRPVVSTMTIIRPHRRPAPHHHMMMVAKPVHRPYTLMAAPSQYRPVYVKKPIYRMPAVAMHRPVMVIPQPVPAETVMVPPRAASPHSQVTKTVSVSYSSSKGKVKPQAPVQMKSEPVENKKYILPQHKPYKPETPIPHYKASQSITTGGFNPGSLVIEGGFKPIIQNTPEAQDRISEDEENDDTEGTIDLTADDEGPKEINIDTKATEYFEPMFIPSPPDSMQKHAKKPTGLEYDMFQKKKTISRKPIRQNMIVIRRRPVSPSSRSQEDGLDETPMAAERMDTYYLPPSGPIYGLSQSGHVEVPANTDSGTPTLLTYDGKPVSGNNVVPPPPSPGFSSGHTKRKTSTAELLRNTPQFGPFRGDIPPPVPGNIRPENIPQLKFKSDKRPAHAMALTLNPEPAPSQGRTQLSLVRQVEEEEVVDGLVPEASELEEYKYDVSGEVDNSTTHGENVIIVLAEPGEKNTTSASVEENSSENGKSDDNSESHVHKRDRRFAHNVPSYVDDKEYHMQHDHEHHLKMMENGTMPHNSGLRLAHPTYFVVNLLFFVYFSL